MQHPTDVTGSVGPADGPPGSGRSRSGVVGPVLTYTALRVGLVVVVTAVVYGLPRAFGVEVPLLFALLIAVVLQLPMAWLLLPRQRYLATQALATRTSQRQRERDRLRAALAGEPPADPPGS